MTDPFPPEAIAEALGRLERVTSDITAYLEQRAGEIAAPFVEKAQQAIAQAADAVAGSEQRLADLQREFGRRDAIRDRIMDNLKRDNEHLRDKLMAKGEVSP
jgi:hypothetical protein